MTLPTAAILAGGLATRLRPITETIPKALVEVAGKPFIAHQIELLRKHGITRVVLCVGYLGEMIRDEIEDGSTFDVHVDYAFDGEKLLGTAGALKKALPLLGGECYILYGDSYLLIDYGAVYEAFRASGKPALMTVYNNGDQWDSSNVIFRDGQILRYDKKNRVPDMHYIDYGLGLMRTEVLNAVPADTVADLADVYHDLAARGDLAGYEAMTRFYEIGSFTGLEETRQLLGG